MSTVHRWDALTREELRELAPEALLVLPLGTTEQHGPHLATGTDALIAAVVAERAARAAARPETILLAPTLAYGASHHHLPFGGTLSLSATTFARVLADLLASAASAGIRRAFLVNGHGGNVAACRSAVDEAAREHGMLAGTTLVGDLVDPAELGGPVSGHAGIFETSVVLALDASRVQLDRARPSPGGGARARRRGLVIAEPGRWQELDGFTDRPHEASRELGERALELCVTSVAAAFEELAGLDG